MLAARNSRFRIAAALAAAAYLVLTARDLIEADHIFRPEVAGGFKVSAALFVGAHLVGACGWLAVATAFDAEIDWPRLRLGGTIVASIYIADFAAWVFRLVPVLEDLSNADYRGLSVASAAAALLIAVGASIIVSGLVDSRRGATRASWLWVGMIFVTVAYLAITVGLLYEQSFYSSASSVHELTVGAMIEAIGAFGVALAALALTVAVRRPLDRREAALTASAAGAAAAFLCIGGGEVLVAIAYTSNGSPTWQDAILWLAVASRLLIAAALVAVALGARAAREPAPVPA